ncbi:MAG: DUF2325 domain-containing protein [Desulfobacteraceae bacterium]|jgi:hypothetical protein
MSTDFVLKNVMKDLNEKRNFNISPMIMPDFEEVMPSVHVPENRIKYVWEVDRHLCCPLIGGCLTIEEHKKVLNKAGLSTNRKRPYELHNIIMCNLDNKNKISLKVDNYLKHKYRKQIPALKKLDEKTFMEKWEKSLRTGNMEALYFVAAVRFDLSFDAIERIFGDVHMINHINLHEINRVKQMVTIHENTNIKLARLFQQQKNKNISLKKELSKLKSSLRNIESVNAALKKQTKEKKNEEDRFIKLRTRNYEFKKRIEQLEEQVAVLSTGNKHLERQKRKVEIKALDLESANHQLTEKMRSIMDKMECINKSDTCNESTCPKRPDCAGRILVVGGRTRMKQHYKNLIESCGGEFEYHDGYVKGGRQDLENRVKRCDMVICPVNCNSHGACESVKKYCQRHMKPFKMLPTSSLSSILKAMTEDVNTN